MSAARYPARSNIVGILLAAGRGRRFDISGRCNKLLQRLPDGFTVAGRAAYTLRGAVSQVVAVVPLGQKALADELEKAGCTVRACPETDAEGLSVSLLHGLQCASTASAWVFALADMPYVRRETISAIVEALEHGADIAAPFHRKRRGNPVGFSRRHLPELLDLKGDAGAAVLMQRHPIENIEVADAGIFLDVDTPDDLAAIVANADHPPVD